jgi:hypothetical protein
MRTLVSLPIITGNVYLSSEGCLTITSQGDLQSITLLVFMLSAPHCMPSLTHILFSMQYFTHIVVLLVQASVSGTVLYQVTVQRRELFSKTTYLPCTCTREVQRVKLEDQVKRLHTFEKKI